jgi:hypothetical protein
MDRRPSSAERSASLTRDLIVSNNYESARGLLKA